MCHHILMDGCTPPPTPSSRLPQSRSLHPVFFPVLVLLPSLKATIGPRQDRKAGLQFCTILLQKTTHPPTFVSLLGVLKAAWTILLLIQSSGSIHNSPPN